MMVWYFVTRAFEREERAKAFYRNHLTPPRPSVWQTNKQPNTGKNLLLINITVHNSHTVENNSKVIRHVAKSVLSLQLQYSNRRKSVSFITLLTKIDPAASAKTNPPNPV